MTKTNKILKLTLETMVTTPPQLYKHDTGQLVAFPTGKEQLFYLLNLSN